MKYGSKFEDEDKKKSGSTGGVTEGNIALNPAITVKPVLNSAMYPASESGDEDN